MLGGGRMGMGRNTRTVDLTATRLGGQLLSPKTWKRWEKRKRTERKNKIVGQGTTPPLAKFKNPGGGEVRICEIKNDPKDTPMGGEERHTGGNVRVSTEQGVKKSQFSETRDRKEESRGGQGRGPPQLGGKI